MRPNDQPVTIHLAQAKWIVSNGVMSLAQTDRDQLLRKLGLMRKIDFKVAHQAFDNVSAQSILNCQSQTLVFWQYAMGDLLLVQMGGHGVLNIAIGKAPD